MGLGTQVVMAVVGLAVLGGCGNGDGGSEVVGDWEFKADSNAAAPVAWVRSVGKEGPRDEPQTRSAILSLDCHPDHTGATIMTEQALRQGTVEVQLRLDGGEPLTVEGFSGTTPTGGQLVLTPPLDSVLGMLGGHEEARVDYEDGAGSSKTTAMFPLAGLDSVRPRFLAACGRR